MLCYQSEMNNSEIYNNETIMQQGTVWRLRNETGGFKVIQEKIPATIWCIGYRTLMYSLEECFAVSLSLTLLWIDM